MSIDQADCRSHLRGGGGGGGARGELEGQDLRTVWGGGGVTWGDYLYFTYICKFAIDGVILACKV